MKKQFKNSWYRRDGCPTGSAKARQIGLLRRAQETTATTGCPLAFQEAAQIEFLPEGRADEGEEAGKTVAPLAQPGAEAQQHIGQQGRPDLPAHGVGAVAQKVSQLEGLFEFLEESFDARAPAIQSG